MRTCLIKAGIGSDMLLRGKLERNLEKLDSQSLDAVDQRPIDLILVKDGKVVLVEVNGKRICRDSGR